MHYQKHPRSLSAPSPQLAAILSVIILGLYSIYAYTGAGQELYAWSKTFAPYSVRQYLGMSKRYLLQYGHIVFLFSLLVLSRYLFISQNHLSIFGPKLQWLNRYSTAIFLFHFPILYFIVAITNYDRNSVFDQIVLLVATLLFATALGRLCFNLKPYFDGWQKRLITKLDGRFPRPQDFNKPSHPISITRSHSEFLTLVKLVATMCVVLGHYSFSNFTTIHIPGFDGAAPRFAVPTFFMMSGYFLMMSIDRSRSGAVGVIVKRAFAMYYILLPMLVITLILDNIGYRADAAAYQFTDYYISENARRPYSIGEIGTIFASSMLYFNESWLFDLFGVQADLGGVRAFSNDPFWFMCYLIPFSVILAVGRLISPPWSIVVLIICCVIIGPPILMLAPLFFAGSLAYIVHQKWGVSDHV